MTRFARSVRCFALSAAPALVGTTAAAHRPRVADDGFVLLRRLISF